MKKLWYIATFYSHIERSTYLHRVIRLRLYSQWVLIYFKNSVSLSTKQLWITPAFTSTVSLVLVRSSQIVLPQLLIPDWFCDEQVKRCTLWFRILYCYNTVISDTMLLHTIRDCTHISISFFGLLWTTHPSELYEISFGSLPLLR